MSEITSCPHRLLTQQNSKGETGQFFMDCDKEKCPYYHIEKATSYTEYHCNNPRNFGQYRVTDWEKANPEILKPAKLAVPIMPYAGNKHLFGGQPK